MHLLVGLGNPGEKYHFTRHNIGFLFLDFLAKKLSDAEVTFATNKKLHSKIYQVPKDPTLDPKPYTLNPILAKPQTFMNTSGSAVKKILDFYHLKAEESLILIHDDLDIDFGNFKIQFGKGPHVHNGVSSVEKSIGTKEFLRVRIGIRGETYDLIKKTSQSIADNYVLKPFVRSEQEQLETIFADIYRKLLEVHL